jgi:hypothetical protein
VSEHQTSSAEGWLQKAEEALQKATEAVGEAWKATEDVRGQAWETAKRAANQAVDALDKGLDAAKETWRHASGDEASPEGDETALAEPEASSDTPPAEPVEGIEQTETGEPPGAGPEA